eukprot:1946345-Rhodomonas_salina.1
MRRGSYCVLLECGGRESYCFALAASGRYWAVTPISTNCRTSTNSGFQLSSTIVDAEKAVFKRSKRRRGHESRPVPSLPAPDPDLPSLLSLLV